MADQSNSGRNALIIGAVFGIAAAGAGAYTMTTGKFATPATEISSGKIDSGLVTQAQAVADNLKRERAVKDAAPNGANINGKPRTAPLFFSTELWQVAKDDEQKNVITDIYDPAGKNVHGDVPNTWFLTNGIEDALQYADALVRDSDGDGFSNKEEFDAQTNPGKADEYPDLVNKDGAKMEVLKVDTANALITLDSMFATAAQKPADVKIRIFKKVEDMSPSYQVTVKPGDSFDLDEKEKGGRFTVVGFEKKQFPDFSGNMADENVIRVRDNVTANARDKEFVIRAGKPTPTAKEKGTPQEKGRRISDKTVTLRVISGSAAGKPEGTVAVQPGAPFEVPGGSCKPNKKLTATVESINASGEVNIRIEGIESPVKVSKAAAKPAQGKK